MNAYAAPFSSPSSAIFGPSGLSVSSASRFPASLAVRPDHHEAQNGPLRVSMEITIDLDEHVTDDFIHGLREGFKSLAAEADDD